MNERFFRAALRLEAGTGKIVTHTVDTIIEAEMLAVKMVIDGIPGHPVACDVQEHLLLKGRGQWVPIHPINVGLIVRNYLETEKKH